MFVPVIPLAETAPPTRRHRHTPRRDERTGLQPDAHPRGPRRADPRDRLRHPGPGGGPPPEPPLGRSAAGRPIPSRGRAAGWFPQPPQCMRRDPERRPTGALHLWWGASVVLVLRSATVERRSPRLPVSPRSSSRSPGRRARPVRRRIGDGRCRPWRRGRSPSAGGSAAPGRRRRASRDPRPPGHRDAPRPAGPDPVRTRPRTAACRPVGRGHRGPPPGRNRPSRRGPARSGRPASETRKPKLASVWVTRATSTRNGPTVERPLGQWLDVEGDGAEARVDVEGVEPVGQPGRTDDPDPRRRVAPSEGNGAAARGR